MTEPEQGNKAEELAREADRGASDRTPLLVLSGVMLAAGLVIGILVLILLLVYFFV